MTTSRSAPTRADITRLEDKVDQLLADHVKQSDLDKLEKRLMDNMNRVTETTPSKDRVDGLERELHEMKQQIGTAWARTMERFGVAASIIYVIWNIFHTTPH